MEPLFPLAGLGLVVGAYIAAIYGRRALAWVLVALAAVVLYVGAFLWSG
jgi:hypothetical protein